FEWQRAESGLVVAKVSADAFCHSMIRSLVGACIPVGEGKKPIEWPAQLLRAKTRDAAVSVAPGHGLIMEGVDYPPDAELAQRAEQTRARRSRHDVDKPELGKLELD
ncbi:MAG TPA: hypothetical protein VK030_02695, partial [Actinomycetales bacterium]|nr:hypothetical protein [Actinomycetales bacterium]